MDPIINKTALQAGVDPSQAEHTIIAMKNAVVAALEQGDAVTLPSLGTFSTSQTPERIADGMIYPPEIKVTFTPSLKLSKQAKR